MATTLTLNSLAGNQYAAVTGRRKKTPYTAFLTGAAEGARVDARQAALDDLRSKELDQTQKNFDASQAAERERMKIAEQEGQKATTISAAQTALGGAYLADKGGLINLKDLVGAGGATAGTPAAATTALHAGAYYTPEMAAQITGEAATTAPALGQTAGLYDLPAKTFAGAGEAAFATDATLAPAAEVSTLGGGEAAAAAAEGAATLDAGGGIYASQAGTPATAANPILLPALAGYAAPKLIDALHKDSMENLGHNITLGAVRHEKTAATVGGGATGAAAGALAGAALTSWSGPGALVGAAVGALAGAASKACIIVTCCTSPDSPEVEVARAYRDRFLTREELRGYYMLADQIVPGLVSDTLLREAVKIHLVAPLIEYGRYKLGETNFCSQTAAKLAERFIADCRDRGRTVESYTRSNGEVI